MAMKIEPRNRKQGEMPTPNKCAGNHVANSETNNKSTGCDRACHGMRGFI